MGKAGVGNSVSPRLSNRTVKSCPVYVCRHTQVHGQWDWQTGDRLPLRRSWDKVLGKGNVGSMARHQCQRSPEDELTRCIERSPAPGLESSCREHGGPST